MKLKITIAAALALIVAPQALAVPGGHSPMRVAKAACAAELARLGEAGFASTYGERPRLGCIRAHIEEARTAFRAAIQGCRTERAADREAFRAKYGRRPMARCLGGELREAVAEEVAETMNAAQECRAERRADPQAFATKYGTNPNRRNAFGKCVSSKAGADAEEPAGEDPAGGGGDEGGTPPVPPG